MSGSDSIGFSPITYSALSSPASIASIASVTVSPARGAGIATPQASANRASTASSHTLA